MYDINLYILETERVIQGMDVGIIPYRRKTYKACKKLLKEYKIDNKSE